MAVSRNKLFDQLVIIDLEATCDDPRPKWQGEIIEVGVCLLDLNSLDITKPRGILVHNTKTPITDFCTKLTTLTQEMINKDGVFLCAQVFGEVRTNSAGREYSVRDIGEDHVLEDLGTIPTLVEVINCIDTKHLKWLGGLPKNKRTLVTKIPKKPEGPSQGPKEEQIAQSPLEPKEAPEEAIRCQECGYPSPPGTHQALMGHEEKCSILEAAVDVVAKNWYAPDEDECVDGGIAYFRRHRAGVID